MPALISAAHEQPMPSSLAYAYSRLSGDDRDARLTLEERFANRRAQLVDLAARHDLELVEIIEERVSGERLSNRPGVLRLLDLCARGLCTHVLVTEQARLLRGDKADEATVERVLTEAGVTLISAAEGVMAWGDPDLDVLPYEVRALVARYERRAAARRRRAANRARYAANERSCGTAPYGWRRDATAEGGYAVVPAEYAILEEVLERVWTESLLAIAEDLTVRQVPTAHGAQRWHRATLRRILSSPFLAGYHARSVRRTAQGRWVQIPYADRTIDTDRPGQWRHPLSLAEHHALLRHLESRWSAGQSRTRLLTGILRNHCGHPMCGAGPNYLCTCKSEGRPRHALMSVDAGRLERYARSVVSACLMALPDDALGDTGDAEEEVERLHADYAAARRQLAARQAELDGLIRQAGTLGVRLGADFDRVVGQVKAERDTARADVARLEERLQEPDPADLRPILAEVRARGFDVYWQEAEEGERREIVRACVSGMAVRAPTGPRCGGIDVTLRGWLRRYRIRMPAWERGSR